MYKNTRAGTLHTNPPSVCFSCYRWKMIQSAPGNYMDWCGFLILKTNDLWKISTRESQIIWKDIRQFTIFKLLATQNVRKGKGKCAQPERGKAITKPRLKKKKKKPTVETASLTATNAPTNPFRSLFGFSDPASLFSSAPVASPLLATAS